MPSPKNIRKRPLKNEAGNKFHAEKPSGKKIFSENRNIILGLIFGLSFILYFNTIFNDYALDDALVITKNEFTQKGFSGLPGIFTFDSFKGGGETLLNQVSGGRYRPLSIATFAIENQFFGNNPHISHLINIILFSLTCIFIFLLLSKILSRFPEKKWYNSIPFIATLLFIVHPIHTEVVANIKSRDEIMSLMFSILSLLFLIKYLGSGKKILLFYSCLIFFLALMSKESAFVFLIIFPLVLFFFLDLSLKKIIQSMLPLIFIIVIFIIIRQILISRTEVTTFGTKYNMFDPFESMTVGQKYATITYTLGLYLKLLFVPFPLTWDYYPYHIQKMEWSDISVVLSVLAYLFLIIVVFKDLRKKSFISFCILLFLVPLSLTSNILFPIGAFMAERFLFVASLGFCLFIAYLAVSKPGKIFRKIFARPYFIILPLLILFSIKTFTRNFAWKNDEVLFGTDVRTSVNSFQSNAFHARVNFEKAEKEKNPVEKAKLNDTALNYFEKAYDIYPKMYLANFYLGTLFLTYKIDLQKAVFYSSNALNISPDNPEAYINLGTAYEHLKEFDKGIGIFEKGLARFPENAELLTNIALTMVNKAGTCQDARERMGLADKAFIFGEKSYRIDPNKKLTNLVLGIINMTYRNDIDKAIFYYENAARIDPGDFNSLNYIGFAYYNRKNYPKAAEYFEKAIKVAPNDQGVVTNLASAYKSMGLLDKADEYFRKARELSEIENRR